MEIKSIKVELRKGDAVSIEIPEEDNGRAPYTKIYVSYEGSIMVCNDDEERIYHLRKTKHGGFRLKEGTLL